MPLRVAPIIVPVEPHEQANHRLSGQIINQWNSFNRYLFFITQADLGSLHLF
jgi:hypothetical protein